MHNLKSRLLRHLKNTNIVWWLSGGAMSGAACLGLIGVAADSNPITAVTATIGIVLGVYLGGWLWTELQELE